MQQSVDKIKLLLKSLWETNYLPSRYVLTCCEIGFSVGKDTLGYLVHGDQSAEKFASFVS
jgi:hypothetical protein